MQTAQKDFHKKLLGRAGELKAKKFLKKQGYKILEQNFSTRIGEIDIIAKDGDILVFVEVKTRTNEDFGLPSEAVTARKRQKYGLVASEYILKNDLVDPPCRFDVVEVEEGKVNLIKDAFTL